VQQDFLSVKRLFAASGNPTFRNSRLLFIPHLRAMFFEFKKVAELGLVIPVSLVATELGFSCQGEINTAMLRFSHTKSFSWSM